MSEILREGEITIEKVVQRANEYEIDLSTIKPKRVDFKGDRFADERGLLIAVEEKITAKRMKELDERLQEERKRVTWKPARTVVWRGSTDN